MLNYFRIKNIRKYLTEDATKILVLSLVISHLDYCNAILAGISENEMNRMQRIQNMCAKLVLSRGKYDSSKDSLLILHWLPIKARIKLKILCIMYNCFIGTAPLYLAVLLHKQSSKRPNLRSDDNSEYCDAVPFNRRKTFNDRGFSTVGPMLWNEFVPLYIRQSPSVDSFKKKCQNSLF
jgi:hypothetical protein